MLTVVETYSIMGTGDESGRTSETIDVIKQNWPGPLSIPAEKKKKESKIRALKLTFHACDMHTPLYTE